MKSRRRSSDRPLLTARIAPLLVQAMVSSLQLGSSHQIAAQVIGMNSRTGITLSEAVTRQVEDRSLS